MLARPESASELALMANGAGACATVIELPMGFSTAPCDDGDDDDDRPDAAV
jgi:hypothetical protein